MADNPAAPAGTPDAEPEMFKVLLSRKVELETHGFTYKPGVWHVVDQTTRDALGGAIQDVKRV